MEMSQQKVYRERQGKRQRQRRGVIKGDVEPQGRRWSQESVYRRSIQGTEARGEETETRERPFSKSLTPSWSCLRPTVQFKYDEAFIHMCDNIGPCHQYSKEWIGEVRYGECQKNVTLPGVEELDWPAQNSGLNPTEHAWDELDQRLRARPSTSSAWHHKFSSRWMGKNSHRNPPKPCRKPS